MIESNATKIGGVWTTTAEHGFFRGVFNKYGTDGNYQRFSSIYDRYVDFDYVLGYALKNGGGRCNLKSYLEVLDWLKTLTIKDQRLLIGIDDIVSERERKSDGYHESHPHAIVLRKWKEVQRSQKSMIRKWKEVQRSQKSMMWLIIVVILIGLIGFFLYYHK